MTWCENNGIDYIFGLSGTKPLARKVDEVADDIRTRRAIENLPVLRGYTETRHKAKSWNRELRTVRRHEPRCRLGRVDLPQPVLRARPSRESDQAA